jgi:hypothetical protein
MSGYQYRGYFIDEKCHEDGEGLYYELYDKKGLIAIMPSLPDVQVYLDKLPEITIDKK